MTRLDIFTEIEREREAQDAQWGGPEHDNTHSLEVWAECIDKQTSRACDDHGETDLAGARERFVKIAALAVAAVESIDRRLQSEPSARSAA